MSDRNELNQPLALLGGPAILPQGPPTWPLADDAVREALARAFADGSWGRYLGPHCDTLVERLAALHSLPHVTLCCSGTIAVELALRGLGVQAGDEVILAGYDFPGNFRAIEAIGARPVLVDVHSRNWQLDVDAAADAVSPQTKAIVASHLHGGCVPIKRLMEVARRHGLQVVEDACQCPGAIIEGRAAGTWGDAGVLSFGGSKLLTAGRGGAVLAASPSVHQRIKVFSDRGNQAFPLSELQAAALAPQLERLAERNAVRASNVSRLTKRLEGVREIHPLFELENHDAGSAPGYYKLGFRLVLDRISCSRDDFSSAVRAEGVALDPGFRGFALRSSQRCRVAGELKQSRLAAERMLLLHHPVLLEPQETIDRVALAIEKVARACATSKCEPASGKTP